MTVDARAQLAKALLGCADEDLAPVQRSDIDPITPEAPSVADA